MLYKLLLFLFLFKQLVSLVAEQLSDREDITGWRLALKEIHAALNRQVCNTLKGSAKPRLVNVCSWLIVLVRVVLRRTVWKSSVQGHLLKMTSTRVVTTNNNPSQDYTIPDDQLTTNTDSPGSQPTTILLRTTPTLTISQL